MRAIDYPELVGQANFDRAIMHTVFFNNRWWGWSEPANPYSKASTSENLKPLGPDHVLKR